MVEERGSLRKPRPERKERIMLVIKISCEVLTFDPEKVEWVSSDEVLASVLNGMTPYDEIGGVEMAFVDGGVEGVVLDYLKQIWPELEVLVFKPEPPPEKEPGVIY